MYVKLDFRVEGPGRWEAGHPASGRTCVGPEISTLSFFCQETVHLRRCELLKRLIIWTNFVYPRMWSRLTSWLLLRSLLSSLRPLQVLNIFHSRRLSDRRPPVVAGVRSLFKTKKELLHWVYGDDRIFQDTNYVRLPSLEKRVLVSRLTGFARKRYPWLSPRIIHAFAFRPDFFQDRKRDAKKPSWGSLYRRIDIPKGRSGRRRLWIPNPPLRRVQRCLLELSLNRALGASIAVPDR